jgi:chemotaxis protein MotB
LQSQIRLDMTRDGLRIQIVDDQNRPMFDSGSAVVKPYMRDLLRAIGSGAGRGAQPPDAGRPHRRPPFGGGDAATATGSCRPTAPMPRGAN